MLKFLFLPSLIVLGAAGQGDPKKADAAKEDLAKLQGEWVMIALERDGQKAPEEDLKTYTRKFEGNKYTVTIKKGDDVQTVQGTITLDPAKKPKTFDAVSTNAEGNKVTSRGIYELTGDTHKLCLSPPDEDRPTEFSAPEGSGRTVITWRRVKAK